MRRKIQTIFRKKTANGLFSKLLLQETILCHADGLKEYFNSILSLSESLLRSSQQQSVIAPIACALYLSSFKAFDAYHRQEVVGSLVTHIGSGSQTEVNSAMSVLLHIVREDTQKMSRFTIFIKGILDYLDNLTIDQIQILFEILSNLALEASFLLNNRLSYLLFLFNHDSFYHSCILGRQSRLRFWWLTRGDFHSRSKTVDKSCREV